MLETAIYVCDVLIIGDQISSGTHICSVIDFGQTKHFE